MIITTTLDQKRNEKFPPRNGKVNNFSIDCVDVKTFT